MPTNKERIAEFLREKAPHGFDDDALCEKLNIRPRQQVNRICRELEAEGLVRRPKQSTGKIKNFWVGPELSNAGGLSPIAPIEPRHRSENWFDEDNIKRAIKTSLEERGYQVVRVAWDRQHGKDIEAVRGSDTVWVTTKGYPLGTPKTSPETQARHYIEAAVLEIALYRGEDANTQLGMGIPDLPYYRSFCDRLDWFLNTARCALLWVKADGAVEIRPPSGLAWGG